ncbi:MAG: pilus assembly protein TadG-related protein [Steroidobacteraceae bacterium]
MVVIAIAMLGLLALAGLALDIGRLVGDKSRLQAAVDAASLSAAKVLDTTSSQAAATAAANNTFGNNIALQGMGDLSNAPGNIVVQYSNTLQPFIAGTNPPLYAQVTATGFSVPATLSTVLGFNIFPLTASAIAGPSATLTNACNLAPMMVCGTPGAPQNGYTTGQITALQLWNGTLPAAAGVGYFLQQSSGAYSQNQDYAGAFSQCSTIGNNDQGQTGTAPATIAGGLDSRFNGNPYPPDAVTTQPAPASPERLQCSGTPVCATVTDGAGDAGSGATYPFSYENMYLPAVQSGNYTNPPAPGGNGVVDRRVLAVPVVDCATAAPGTSRLPVIGLACMFMLQDVDATTGQVFSEVVNSCEVNGNPGPVPNNGPGPYTIQLYHIPGSDQS